MTGLFKRKRQSAQILNPLELYTICVASRASTMLGGEACWILDGTSSSYTTTSLRDENNLRLNATVVVYREVARMPGAACASADTGMDIARTPAR